MGIHHWEPRVLQEGPLSQTLDIANIEHKATLREYSIQFESNLLLQLVKMGCQTFNKIGIYPPPLVEDTLITSLRLHFVNANRRL